MLVTSNCNNNYIIVLFYCILDQINAALVSIRDFQEHKKILTYSNPLVYLIFTHSDVFSFYKRRIFYISYNQ